MLHPAPEATMLRAALAFFVIAIIAAIFGFGGIASSAVGIAKILFFAFLVLAAISLLAGLVRS
jgi:uncharacterized membrane protein YtjA (UPF0391 family)